VDPVENHINEAKDSDNSWTQAFTFLRENCSKFLTKLIMTDEGKDIPKAHSSVLKQHQPALSGSSQRVWQ